MDPALEELLLSGSPTDVVDAVTRLHPGAVLPRRVRPVSRFGAIHTIRLKRGDVRWFHAQPEVASLKAARPVAQERAAFTSSHSHQPRGARIPPRAGDSSGGRGVVVGVVDWGIDFVHHAFRSRDGSTRLFALWDQRGPTSPRSPRPFGYGRAFSYSDINRALQHRDPYAHLGYHPAEADNSDRGSHGTHVAGIAAGSETVGGPAGIAPASKIVFVHLGATSSDGLATLGDSTKIMEAVDFIRRVAGTRPFVVNLSVGRHGGPHDGSTLAEIAFDSLLTGAHGRFIVQSAGNYLQQRAHATRRLHPQRVRDLPFIVKGRDRTPNEIEVWYPGSDAVDVRCVGPGSARSAWTRPGGISDIREHGRTIGRIYNRQCDPNNRDNHIDCFLDAAAPAGRWRLELYGATVRNGQLDAWIERDDGCADCQVRFPIGVASPRTTLGTLATGHLPLVVGALDSRRNGRPPAPFSSSGPTRDGRTKPDILAPGVAVVAPRSASWSRSAPWRYTAKSGTSMAAPHVTGAVAQLLSATRGQLGAVHIRDAVLTSADPVIGNLTEPFRSGAGALNIAGAVRHAHSIMTERQRWH